MKVKYEYDIVSSDGYYLELEDKKKEGWETYKTEVITKEEKSFGFKSSTLKFSANIL